MISELVLAREHKFFWDKAFPFLSRVVKKINLEKKTFCNPLESNSNPSIRAVLNEVGFRLFQQVHKLGVSSASDLSEDEVDYLISESFVRHYRFLGIDGSTQKADLSELELSESFSICARLINFFKVYDCYDDLTISPVFRGCGVLNISAGDVISGNNLCEIKSADRDFRNTDLKQLLVYASLISLDSNYSVTEFSLLNPRRGVFSKIDLLDVTEISSGLSPQEAILEIVNYLDFPDITA